MMSFGGGRGERADACRLDAGDMHIGAESAREREAHTGEVCVHAVTMALLCGRAHGGVLKSPCCWCGLSVVSAASWKCLFVTAGTGYQTRRHQPSTLSLRGQGDEADRPATTFRALSRPSAQSRPQLNAARFPPHPRTSSQLVEHQLQLDSFLFCFVLLFLCLFPGLNADFRCCLFTPETRAASCARSASRVVVEGMYISSDWLWGSSAVRQRAKCAQHASLDRYIARILRCTWTTICHMGVMLQLAEVPRYGRHC